MLCPMTTGWADSAAAVRCNDARVLDCTKYGANESSFVMAEQTSTLLVRDISRRQWCGDVSARVLALYETVSALEWRCPRREPRTNLANQAVI